MTDPWGVLAEYERPPVVETVLSVRFKALRALDWMGIPRFIDATRPGARVEVRAPYEMPIERFDGVLRRGRLQLTSHPGVPRYWIHDPDDEYLVQLQNDWLAFNWRQREGGDYRRYGPSRAGFEALWGDLTSHLAGHGSQAPIVEQAEITYINHIRATDGGWSSHGDIADITRLVGELPDTMPAPESISSTARFVIPNDAGEPYARLHATVEPGAVPSSQAPLYVMNLTVRGKPEGSRIEDLLGFFDAGHRWIVGSFAQLATPHMDEVWGRKEHHEPSR